MPAKFIRKFTVDANAERQPLARVAAVKLIDRIEPRGVALNIKFLARMLIEHIERLFKIGPKPQEFMAHFGFDMIAVRRDRRRRVVVHDQDSTRFSERKRTNEVSQLREMLGICRGMPQLGSIKVEVTVRQLGL